MTGSDKISNKIKNSDEIRHLGDIELSDNVTTKKEVEYELEEGCYHLVIHEARVNDNGEVYWVICPEKGTEDLQKVFFGWMQTEDTELHVYVETRIYRANIGAAIRKKRESLHLSAAELAKRMDISEKLVLIVERGAYNMSIDLLNRFVLAMGSDVVLP